MKKNSLYAIGFSALFITASLFSSCKKERGDEEQVPDLTADVFYKQRVAGSTADEYRAVKVNGTNDHKLNVVLPAGWELTNAYQLNESDLRAVSAYNSTTKQYGLFTTRGQNVVNFTQQREITSANDIIPQGSFFDGNQYLLYSKRTPTNAIGFSITIPGGLVSGGDLSIPLPANAEFVGEPILRSLGKTVAFCARVKDPVSQQYTYWIYRYTLGGSGLASLVVGEPGVALGAEQLIRQNILLYSKVKNNGSVTELWSINLDGGNDHKVELALPAGTVLKNKDMVRVSNEGGIAFLCTSSADNSATAKEAIYTAKADGSDVKLVKQFAAGVSVGIQAYVTYAWY